MVPQTVNQRLLAQIAAQVMIIYHELEYNSGTTAVQALMLLEFIERPYNPDKTADPPPIGGSHRRL